MLVSAFKSVAVGVSFLAATFWVQEPVYFTQAQYYRPLVIQPTPTPSPSPTPVPSPSPISSPTVSPSPTPVVLGEQIEIPAEMETPYGKIRYNRVIRDVWAMSYDSTCPGCSETTATGMKQGYGVVAVDPELIPLYSRVYVPGYGIGIAGDVGGAIKGRKIDLGYDTLNGQWTARFVDVYLLAE